MMNSSNLKYLKNLYKNSGLPSVIVNKSLAVEWQNNSFTKYSEALAGYSEKSFVISQILPINFQEIITLTSPSLIKLPDGHTLSVIPIDDKEEIFYLLSLMTKEDSEIEKNGSLTFQKELQEILSLLVHEKSLTVLSQEILNKSISVTDSYTGVLILFKDEHQSSFEIIAHDKNKILSGNEELKQEIRNNLTYMVKWLILNERTLLIGTSFDSAANNLLSIMQSKHLAISPCVFDGKLLSIIILGKKENEFLSAEVKHLDQLSIFQAFAVSSIKTRELNYMLEAKLLQSQKLETIGKLASGMAHDFSNLLSSIFGSLNLLKRKISSVENVNHLIDNIENCAIRAKDLTTGLLSYGKPTPKRKELIQTKKILNEIITVITETFPKSITAKFNIEENLNDVLGNSTEIYQVMLNLCVNAKEAVGDSGEIILSALNLKINDDNIFNYPFLKAGNHILLSVHDNGTGIEEENILKIFDPYFTTKQKEGGSGLGLYVTYGIIKAHNGYINVKSIIGEGTTFEIYLPAYEESDAEKTFSEEKIILIADDEIMLRDLLGDLLESHGYHVIKVHNGAEALLVLTEEIKVDLMIIDFNMPVMNGLDCIKQIRKIGLTVPVILSTGSLPSNYLEEIEEQNITSIVNKPYEFDDMLKTIRKII